MERELAGNLELFLGQHPDLIAEASPPGHLGRRFRLRLPEMNAGREFGDAWLVLPEGFPGRCARLQMSPDAVLQVPHVDSEGILCFSGDAGPGSGATPEDRIQDMLYRFSEDFLKPWQRGMLDNDFETESQNYWTIHVSKHARDTSPIRSVYTIDDRPSAPLLRGAVLMLPMKSVIVGESDTFIQRIRDSLGPRAKQIVRMAVLDIPVDFPFSPLTWPNNKDDLEQLLTMRVDEAVLREFNLMQKKKAQYRIVLLRSPSGSYAYLLPGGPVQEIKVARKVIHQPNLQIQPLMVFRLDPAWTTGRDTNSKIASRQVHHILVIGAGAIGSPVIDQLARAGVGRISVIDPEYMVPANAGRHLLGIEAIGTSKAQSVSLQVGRGSPSCHLSPYVMSGENWLERHSLTGIDLVVDLTGEPEVRYALESQRQENPVSLVIGWLEPYVAAAHACILTPSQRWLRNGADILEQLQSIDWPQDVIQREPGCSSRFQSYTPAAAAYAVAMITEAILEVIDGENLGSHVRSWVRSQRFVDRQRMGLVQRDWVKLPANLDGAILRRDFHA